MTIFLRSGSTALSLTLIPQQLLSKFTLLILILKTSLPRAVTFLPGGRHFQSKYSLVRPGYNEAPKDKHCCSLISCTCCCLSNTSVHYQFITLGFAILGHQAPNPRAPGGKFLPLCLPQQAPDSPGSSLTFLSIHLQGNKLNTCQVSKCFHLNDLQSEIRRLISV